MKRSIEVALIDAQNKMLGHVSNMSYMFCNICVKADPSSLLGVEMSYGGMDKRIEDVADVMVHEDENERHMMNVYPKNSAYFSCLYQGITEAHPEIKITLETAPGADEKDGLDAKYLLLTMPEVDKDRRDLVNTAINALHTECSAKLDAEKVKATAEVGSCTVGSPEEVVKEAKDKLQEIYDTYVEMMEKLYNDKVQEVEEAYKCYVAGNVEGAPIKRDEQSGQSMNMDGLFDK